LDESHATHVSSQVEHPLHALARCDAVVDVTKVEQEELVAEFIVLHELVLLPVNATNIVTVGLELLGKVGSNEATGSRDEHSWLGSNGGFGCSCLGNGGGGGFVCCCWAVHSLTNPADGICCLRPTGVQPFRRVVERS